jgi:hypothetical protein
MLTEGKTYKIRYKDEGVYKDVEMILERTVNTIFDPPNDICYVFEVKGQEDRIAVYPEDISSTEEITG